MSTQALRERMALSPSEAMVIRALAASGSSSDLVSVFPEVGEVSELV